MRFTSAAHLFSSLGGILYAQVSEEAPITGFSSIAGHVSMSLLVIVSHESQNESLSFVGVMIRNSASSVPFSESLSLLFLPLGRVTESCVVSEFL
jgi:hypothetical protein